MPFEGEPIELNAGQRSELSEIARSQSLPAGFVLRAKILLLLADGLSYDAIKEKLDTTAPTISRWKKRFLEAGLDGLETHRPGQTPSKLTPACAQKSSTPLAASPLTVRRIGPAANSPNISASARISFTAFGARPTSSRIGSSATWPPTIPTSSAKPPTSSASISIRRDRVLPLSPGRAERHGFEYKRNGTLSLYAALNTQTGRVQGKTAARHTSNEFVAFLGEVVAGCDPGREIHIILDNLSAHKTKLVDSFLDQHPNVSLHFTPTYSSWLNQVELWFSKVQRDVIARGIFTSTADLARKLRRYINAYSKAAKPIRWKYSNPRRRIRHANTSSATFH